MRPLAIPLSAFTDHLYHEVQRNVEKYLVKDALQPLVNKLLRDGKQIFLLTNSKLPTVQLGMEHMLGKDWRDAFDVVIVQSEKPNFFDVQDRPFQKISTKSEETASSMNEIQKLMKGEIYCGGCCNELMRLKKWKSGEVN